ncbi:FHA domain-containing protein [Haliangium sp.]|uniref:FHA domain-containing protein n=1 Tax=Haliangium sp. TaxID=2663208 RepID=UPI003D0FEC73
MLEYLDTGATHELSSTYLVGRGRECDLRLRKPTVSGEHAVFRWHDMGWELRDLGSLNGTFVDGERLTPGVAYQLLTPEVVISFGDADHEYRLVDLEPPRAMARTHDGVVVGAEDGVLLLPNPHRCELIISEVSPGVWSAESQDGRHRSVRDGDMVPAGGGQWQLMLPGPCQRTMYLEPMCNLADARLRLYLNQDHELIRIALVHRRGTLDIAPRAHDKLLLFLAKRRLAHRGERGRTLAGWVHVDDALTALYPHEAATESRLNLDVFRVRHQFIQAQVKGAKSIIERRKPGRLRLGTADVEVIEPGAAGRPPGPPPGACPACNALQLSPSAGSVIS